MSTSMHTGKNIAKRFWDETISTVCYVSNRVLGQVHPKQPMNYEVGKSQLLNTLKYLTTPTIFFGIEKI